MTVSLRLRFCRREPAIWLAHLDMMRTFERSVRRAGIPVAYSGGFNPRPRLAFALPIGVGLATEDDRLDIQLEDGIAIDQTKAAEWTDALNRNLPDGLTVYAGELTDSSGPSLMSLVTAAEYRLQTTGLQAAVQQLEAQKDLTAWIVDKNSKGKTVKTDIRPLILATRLEESDQVVLLVRAGSRQNLRPDLFLQILVAQGGLNATAAADSRITRTRLWLGEEP
ncbi:MAG: TIGR03936 family radical SAM-associated protein [Bacillota bacterium]|nr:TIGR03936 family radical SAM-associated protein [Bacillota bacterium]